LDIAEAMGSHTGAEAVDADTNLQVAVALASAAAVAGELVDFALASQPPPQPGSSSFWLEGLQFWLC